MENIYWLANLEYAAFSLKFRSAGERISSKFTDSLDTPSKRFVSPTLRSQMCMYIYTYILHIMKRLVVQKKLKKKNVESSECWVPFWARVQ